jgi:hypothetical protein
VTFPTNRKSDRFSDLERDLPFYVDHRKTMSRLRRLKVPFEYAVSPSGCYAYRLPFDLDHEECTIVRNLHPSYAHLMLPVVAQGGTKSRIPMHYSLTLPELWGDWKK